MAEPFLYYLTVFKSRVGAVSLVLDETSFAHQPMATLERKLRAVLDRRTPVNVQDPSNDRVLRYLSDKKLLSANLRRTGRYRGYALSRARETWAASDQAERSVQQLPIYDTDRWLSDSAIRSTIGVPTPEVAGEVIEFAHQLGVLSRSKNTWTSAGQMIAGLRSLGRAENANPFVLGVEAVGYLRQVVEKDGLLMRELVRYLAQSGLEVTRDGTAKDFAEIVARAVAAVRKAGVSPPEQRTAREFQARIEATTLKAQQVASASGSRKGTSGPGVIEHRLSPRLEWLTDFGYLDKSPQRKNAFSYTVAPALTQLLSNLDEHIGQSNAADEVALAQWRTNPFWKPFRARHATASREAAFLNGYSLMRRRIGPSPFREVTLVAALLMEDAPTYSDAATDLTEFAQATEGVTLAGGRYTRAPENITIPRHMIEHLT